MSSPSHKDTQNPPVSPATQPSWLDVLREKVEGLRYGLVEITVSDWEVTQIVQTEKIRLPAGNSRPDTAPTPRHPPQVSRKPIFRQKPTSPLEARFNPMKMHKFIPAGLLALALAPLSALATPTVIRVTAGTAFRPAVEAAIINILNSPTAAFVGASLPKATSAVIAGTLKSGLSAGQSVVFEILWAGSNAGIAAAAQQSPVVTDVFPTASNTLSSVSLNGSAGSYTFSGATSLSSGSVITENAQPDAIPSITFQSSTIFFGAGYNTLNDAVVLSATPL